MNQPCPACGYIEDLTNYRRAINNLLKKRGGSVARILRTTINKIAKYTPSQREQKRIYLFLFSIDQIDDETVRYGLKQYLNGRYYMEQKGYAYLRTIIANTGKDSKIKKVMEKKRYGTSPKEQVL